jgi:hypothetical protein
MSEAKGGKIATVISVLALLVSFAALRLQFKEREDRIADRAEVLDYEIGSERVDPKQYDDYIRSTIFRVVRYTWNPWGCGRTWETEPSNRLSSPNRRSRRFWKRGNSRNSGFV